MRRAIANLFSTIYFVLFAVVVFMWVRGCAVADHLRHQSPSGFRGAVSSRGDLAIYSYSLSAASDGSESGWSLQTGALMDIPAVEREKAVRHRSFVGFHFFRDSKIAATPTITATLRGWCMVMPYWFLTLLFGLLPLGRLLRMSAQAPRRAKSLPPQNATDA